jgi:hypothetical protein
MRGDKFTILFSVFTLGILAGSIFVNFDANAEPQIKTVHPKIPHIEGSTTFDTWIAFPSTENKADAVRITEDESIEDTYILRVSDSKWQTFILDDATTGENAIAPETGIISVTLYANVKNVGEKPGTVSLGCETGKNKNSIYQGGDEVIINGGDYETISFPFEQNPATKPLRNWNYTDISDWIIDGNQLACGVVSQDRQNLAPIQVTEFWAEIAFDGTGPEITPNFSGTQGDNEWYTTDGDLTWTVVDNESAIISTEGCGLQSVSGDTTGSDYTCSATSGGGTTSVTSTIKIDTTAPEIELPSPEPVQAPTPAGANVIFAAPNATDSISGPATISCDHSSGDLYVIGFTEVTCDAQNQAGLNSTDSFTVQVNPYLAIAFTSAIDGEVLLEKYTTLQVVDPYINDPNETQTITAEILTDAKTAGANADPALLNLVLTETGDDTSTFEGRVLISSGNTNSTVTEDNGPVLHADDQSTVTANYPIPPDSRTSTTTATTSGASGATALKFTGIAWENDVYSVGQSGKINYLIKGCNFTGDVDTLKVRVTSYLDSTGFNVDLQETGPTTCLFQSIQSIDFVTTQNPAPPALKVKSYKTVTVDDSPSLNLRSADAYIIPKNTATPTGGIALDTSQQLVCVSDNDEDGICDSWEKQTGLVIPFNGSTYTLPCNANIANDCPSPDVKDIYVEFDYMINHKPILTSLDIVKDAFLNSPEGINLHIYVDENTQVHDEFITLDEFYATKVAHFGTKAERENPESWETKNQLNAKRQVFHWAYNVHQQDANKLSSGYAEVIGNDFLISMGSFPGHTGTEKQFAQTFMHELGHNLGLNHGGSATNTQNCKPHYISIMNYAYQFDTWTANPVDFSRVKNVDIDENDPNEVIGMKANNGLTAVFGPVNLAPNGMRTIVLDADKSIDWNKDESITSSGTGQTNINRTPLQGCQNDDGYPIYDRLTGYNDWSGLKLEFRHDNLGTFANGIASLDPIDGTKDQGNTEPTSGNLTLALGSIDFPIAIAGDISSPTEQILADEGDVIKLASHSSDDDGIDNSKTSVPPGVMWNINYDENNNVFDDPGVDAIGSPSPIFLDDDESGGANDQTGNFTVGLRVIDVKGNQNLEDDTVVVTIRNVAPNVDAGADAGPIYEGDTITLSNATFTDQGIFDCGNDSCSSTINWGEQGGSNLATTLEFANGTSPVFDPETQAITSPLVPTKGNVTLGSHTYSDNGNYTVTVNVTDKDSGEGSDNLTVEVLNVPPTVQVGANQTIIIGEALGSFSANFTDPGADIWDIEIDWGDGSAPYTVNDVLVTGDIVFPAHDYSTIGQFDVTITVNDDDGGFDSGVIGITIGLDYDEPSPIASPIDNSQVKVGRNLPVNVSFKDASDPPVIVGPPTYDALKIGVWLDDVTDGIGNELVANSTKKNVKDNLMTWKSNTQQYEFGLSTDYLNTGTEGADHRIIIKVLDDEGNPIPTLTFYQTMKILP